MMTQDNTSAAGTGSGERGAGGAAATPVAGEGGERAGVGGGGGKGASGTRTGVLLVVLAAGWAGLTLYAASRVPGPGLVLPLMIGFGLVVIALAWAGAAFMSWAFKRRMSVAGWISVPAAVVLVFALPWQAWFWGARVRSAGPELAALSDRYEYLREGDFRAIEPASRAGAFEVVRVTRLKGGTALALTSGSGHETGLLRAGGDVAPAPEWATSRRARRLGGEWWRYEWRGE